MIPPEQLARMIHDAGPRAEAWALAIVWVLAGLGALATGALWWAILFWRPL